MVTDRTRSATGFYLEKARLFHVRTYYYYDYSNDYILPKKKNFNCFQNTKFALSYLTPGL